MILARLKRILALSSLTLLLAPSAISSAQSSETGFVRQAIQIQQESSEDTRIADYFEQLKSRPLDPQVHLRLGNLYLERELYELAISSFQHALALQAVFPDAHVGLSQVFRKKKIPGLELQEMEAAVADAPEDPGLRLRLGSLYMEPTHFDYAKAKKQYRVLQKLKSPLASELGTKMGLHPSP